MSKQADEKLHTRLVEISTSYGSYILSDKTLWPKMFEAIEKYVSRNYTPNSVVEQRCFEARAEEIFSILPALGIVGDVNADQTISVEELWSYLVGRKKEHEAQLTNLQNKEGE